MLPDILPVRPYLREMIWGGRGLQEHYGKDLPAGKSIGESWEVSAYRGMESVVSQGDFAGCSLRRLAEEHGRELLGGHAFDRYGGEFPLLIKLLDACDDLSIQVHPADCYARTEELGEFGKMEAWYVLRSDHGRIACGLEEGIGRAEFGVAIREGRAGDAIRFTEVAPGDVVFLPPGTVHALCRGVMLYEVQQSSDLTFRIYDYNRPGSDGKPRELHIARALDVIAFAAESQPPAHWRDLPGANPDRALLVDTEHFRLERFSPGDGRFGHAAGDSFSALTLLSGRADVSGTHETYPLRKGETCLIPAGREFTVAQRGDTQLEYLISSVP